MYNRILVPLDGSALAEAILPQVQRLTRGTQPEIVIVRAYDTPAELGPLPDVMAALRDRAQRYIEETRGRIAASGAPFKGVKGLSRGGAAATVILDTAAEVGADLIAMTTHGYSGLSHWLHGNVAERVLHHSRVPVLMMKSFDRHEAGQIPAPHAEIRKILMPIDGSRGSEQVLPHALELSRRFDAEVTLLFVIEGESLHKHVTAAYGGQHLHALVERLRGEGERVVGATESGYPADRIVHYARHYGMDLITMATHGRTGLVHLWLGSVAEKVIRSMARPILLVRTQEETGKK